MAGVNDSVASLPPHLAELARQSGLGEPLGVFEKGLSDGKLFAKYRLTCVFQHGCVLGNGGDRKTDQFRWDEVDRFVMRIVRKYVNGSYRSTVHTYEFHLAKRTVNVIGVSTAAQTSGVEGFADLVDPLVTACQLPGMVERLRQGETLRFGFLRLTPDGLFRPAIFGSGKLLPWAEVAGIEVKSGDLIVRQTAAKRAWYKTPVAEVPNLTAFQRLLSMKLETPG